MSKLSRKWWTCTTLVETLILFCVHTHLIFSIENFGSIKYVYFATSLFHVILRGIGYRGTFTMTSDWFKSKLNTNMGLAYSFYLPQIFLMSLHINCEKNIPFFTDSSFSKIFLDYIFLVFCLSLLSLSIILCSNRLYKSFKIYIFLLIVFYFLIEKNLHCRHFSFHFPCVFFAILIFFLSRYFPSCFTYGEYSIVCQVIVLCSLMFLQKYYWKILPNKKLFSLQLSTRLMISVTLSCLVNILIYSFTFIFRRHFFENRCPFIFELFSFGFSSYFLLYFFKIALNLSNIFDVVLWLLNYIMVPSRIMILGWCFFVTLSTVFFVFCVYKYSFIVSSVIISRKFFHFAIVACYAPGVIFDDEFLSILSSFVLWLFCLIECVRLSKFTNFSLYIDRSLFPFLKPGCSTWFIIPNHFLLLIATSLPLWTVNFVYFGTFSNVSFASRIVYLFSTLVSVGIGDSVASIIGLKYGKNKVLQGKKSYEGLFASFISQFLLYGIIFRVFSGNIWFSYYDFVFLVCSGVTASIEAITMQEDNLIVPILSISLMIALFPNTY